jgi:hypothetical protein
MIVGLQLGTVEGDRPLVEAMPKEVQVAVEALEAIAEKLPRDPALQAPPTADEIKQAEDEKAADPEKRAKDC